MRVVAIAALTLSSVLAMSQTTTNFRVFPSSVTQTEPVIAVHPTNPSILFASARTINTANGFQSEGVYTSTNAGLTWFGSDTCTGQFISNHGGDPAVVITAAGRFILTHIGSVFPGVYSHYSDNMGATWSTAATIGSQQPEDKGSIMTSDDDPTSPYYGRIYAAWVNFSTPYPVVRSYSTNAGQSWSASSAINSPLPGRRSSGAFVKTGDNGLVMVCWAGVPTSPPFTEDFVGFAVSTNGGVNWTARENIYDMNGIFGTLPSKGNIRVDGLPRLEVDRTGGSRNGWLYIVTTEKNLAPAGSDPDIIMHRSTDGGATWSAGIRINQDPVNNGKIQYFPEIAVDSHGDLNVIFCDDRNTSSDSAEVMLARSTDGGNTWTERVISGHRFKPKPITGGPSGYQGDHIGLLIVNRQLYALWMDDFSGIYQIWMTIIDLDANDVGDDMNDVPSEVALQQNYPNPFNPKTEIRYQVPEVGRVLIKVYDVLGREVATLVNETKDPGAYTVTWSPDRAASGVYYYRLTAGEQIVTKKMVLIR